MFPADYTDNRRTSLFVFASDTSTILTAEHAEKKHEGHRAGRNLFPADYPDDAEKLCSYWLPTSDTGLSTFNRRARREKARRAQGKAQVLR
ncbi:hypothetical protein D3C85_913190 [compost metagenome]